MAKIDPPQYDFDYYLRQKTKMVTENRARNTMYRAMDDMWHNEISLPAQLLKIEGFHQVTPTEPSDAIQTARRLLSTIEPKVTYHPLDNTPESREKANVVEKSLSWHYQRASRMSVSSLTADIVLSALLYDSVDMLVEYIPWQKKLAEVMGKRKQWQSSGDFALTAYNSQDVYTRRSNRGLRCVLLYTKTTPEDVIDTWGKKAEKIIDDYADSKKADGKEFYPEYVFYCDYWDDTDRVVWLEFAESEGAEEKNVIVMGAHKLPFIPWVCRAGGSAIDKKPEYQRRPLLTSIYQAKSWVSVAIMESLLVTEAIKTGAAPLTYTKTVDKKTPSIDYTNIGGNVNLGLQDEIGPLPKPQIDARLTEQTDRLEARMSRSTLPSTLSDPSFSAGTAFATVNASLRAASNALDPAKTLSETGLADANTLMLQWLVYARKPLYAYDHADKRSGSYGDNLMVDYREIPPDSIYITIKLTPNLPLDKISEINAVSLIMDKFGISKEAALEMLDFINAAAMLEEGAQEAMTGAEIQGYLAVIQAKYQAQAQAILDEQQLQTQQAQMQMQMEAQGQQVQQQQAMQQDQMAQQQEQQPGMMPGDVAMAQQQATARAAANIPPDQAASELAGLTGNMQGMGSDPSMGGMSPSGALPGALTREAKNKRTTGGEPIQGA